MTARPHISDPEIEASASEIATAVLEHPLARRLGLDVWVLTAIAAGDPSIRPSDARPVLRLALAAIRRAGESAMTSSRLPMEDLTLTEVSARLRKSKRWLQYLLAEDKRRRPAEQRFQFHGRIGRTPVWTEAQFQLLRAAIKAESAKAGDAGGQRGLRSSSSMATGTFTGRSSLKDAESAFAEVLAYRPSRSDTRRPMRNGAGSRRTSGVSSPTSPGQVLTFRSPPKPT